MLFVAEECVHISIQHCSSENIMIEFYNRHTQTEHSTANDLGRTLPGSARSPLAHPALIIGACAFMPAWDLPDWSIACMRGCVRQVVSISRILGLGDRSGGGGHRPTWISGPHTDYLPSMFMCSQPTDRLGACVVCIMRCGWKETRRKRE